MSTNENPAPRWRAESRVDINLHSPLNSSMAQGVTPDSAARYIAAHCGLALPVASLVARLADLGRALA